MRISLKNLGKGIEAVADAVVHDKYQDIITRKPQEVAQTEFDVENYQPQQYQLGGLTQTTPFTPEAIRAQNYADARQYLLSKGSLGKDYLKTLREEKAAESEEELRGLQIATAKRASKKAVSDEAALEMYKSTVKDPAAYLKKQFDADVIGSRDMAGKKVMYQPTNGGYMAWVTDADGKAVLDERGSPLAQHMTVDQVNEAAYRTFLQTTSPEKLAEWESKRRKDESEAAYRDRMAGVAEQNADTNERYRKMLGAKAAATAGAAGSKLKPEVKDRLDFLQSNYGRLQAAYNKAAEKDTPNDKELARLSDQMQDAQAEMYDLVGEKTGARSKAEWLGLEPPGDVVRAISDRIVSGGAAVTEADIDLAIAKMKRAYRNVPELQKEGVAALERIKRLRREPAPPTAGLQQSTRERRRAAYGLAG